MYNIIKLQLAMTDQFLNQKKKCGCLIWNNIFHIFENEGTCWITWEKHGGPCFIVVVNVCSDIKVHFTSVTIKKDNISLTIISRMSFSMIEFEFKT